MVPRAQRASAWGNLIAGEARLSSRHSAQIEPVPALKAKYPKRGYPRGRGIKTKRTERAGPRSRRWVFVGGKPLAVGTASVHCNVHAEQDGARRKCGSLRCPVAKLPRTATEEQQTKAGRVSEGFALSYRRTGRAPPSKKKKRERTGEIPPIRKNKSVQLHPQGRLSFIRRPSHAQLGH